MTDGQRDRKSLTVRIDGLMDRPSILVTERCPCNTNHTRTASCAKVHPYTDFGRKVLEGMLSERMFARDVFSERMI